MAKYIVEMLLSPEKTGNGAEECDTQQRRIDFKTRLCDSERDVLTERWLWCGREWAV